MLIVQATRVLTEVHWSMFAKINSDYLGNPCDPFTLGLSACDIDATGALNTPDVSKALRWLATRAERRMGPELGVGWHDLV